MSTSAIQLEPTMKFSKETLVGGTKCGNAFFAISARGTVYTYQIGQVKPLRKSKISNQIQSFLPQNPSDPCIVFKLKNQFSTFKKEKKVTLLVASSAAASFKEVELKFPTNKAFLAVFSCGDELNHQILENTTYKPDEIENKEESTQKLSEEKESKGIPSTSLSQKPSYASFSAKFEKYDVSKKHGTASLLGTNYTMKRLANFSQVKIKGSSQFLYVAGFNTANDLVSNYLENSSRTTSLEVWRLEDNTFSSIFKKSGSSVTCFEIDEERNLLYYGFKDNNGLRVYKLSSKNKFKFQSHPHDLIKLNTIDESYFNFSEMDVINSVLKIDSLIYFGDNKGNLKILKLDLNTPENSDYQTIEYSIIKEFQLTGHDKKINMDLRLQIQEDESVCVFGFLNGKLKTFWEIPEITENKN